MCFLGTATNSVAGNISEYAAILMAGQSARALWSYDLVRQIQPRRSATGSARVHRHLRTSRPRRPKIDRVGSFRFVCVTGAYGISAPRCRSMGRFGYLEQPSNTFSGFDKGTPGFFRQSFYSNAEAQDSFVEC